MTRLPYDRLGILIGFAGIWCGLSGFISRSTAACGAASPSSRAGRSSISKQIEGVDWKTLRPRRARRDVDCDAIVADFSADLPDEWESFLADAALAGRMVYQVKQLSESLTGRVEVDASVGEQLRQPDPGARLFPFEDRWSISCWRWSLLPICRCR